MHFSKIIATVARKGQKKARINLSTTARLAPLGKTSHCSNNKEKSENPTSSTKAISDNRLFLRLPQDQEWCKLSPAGVREVMVKKLHISPSIISRIKPVHSGFALSPSNSEVREKILKAENGLFLSGAKLEPATNCVSVLVPTVTAFIQMEEGQVEVSKSMLSDEIERVCSVRPAYIKLFGQNNSKAPHRTWMAYFCKAPRSGFRVFDESGIMRPYKKQQSIEFCKRCNGHHPSKNCSRAPSCGNCGSKNHNVDICKAATKCRNCGGPHRADSRRCLARPTRSGAPSKEQLKVYRQAGEREYQAVLRVRAAEEKAMITEKIIIDSTNSNLPEADSSSDIIQVTPDEVSTGVASRL
ncbi:putative eka-like protein [Erysiphe necator]|uniref:Putative eka-like protein n=1 Tax=Uncinula necator TaxID=52586 RepID=A0A0B1NXH6_UNCNE|nr:putative eka-like protein [Erysiphe necator]